MFTVSTAASHRSLTTRDRVKALLSIDGAAEDDNLDFLISSVSEFVCRHLNVAAAADGSITLARETVVETFLLRERRSLLQLARAPVTSVTSVLEDEETTSIVQDIDFQLTAESGFLRRITSSNPGLWAARKIVVTYEAGWILPGSSDRNLPFPIETAVIDLIKNERDGVGRSAHLRAEEVPGVERREYFANIMNTKDGMPPETAAKLKPFIRARP